MFSFSLFLSCLFFFSSLTSISKYECQIFTTRPHSQQQQQYRIETQSWSVREDELWEGETQSTRNPGCVFFLFFFSFSRSCVREELRTTTTSHECVNRSRIQRGSINKCSWRNSSKVQGLSCSNNTSRGFSSRVIIITIIITVVVVIIFRTIVIEDSFEHMSSYAHSGLVCVSIISIFHAANPHASEFSWRTHHRRKIPFFL